MEGGIEGGIEGGLEGREGERDRGRDRVVKEERLEGAEEEGQGKA
jgi:hypothetical protein